MGKTIKKLKYIVLMCFGIIFVRKYYYKLYKALYIIALKGMGHLNYESDFVSGEKYIVEKLVKAKRPVIVDVGAYEGNYISLIKNTHPNAYVVAFEPNKASFNILKHRYSTDNVILYNIGLGEKRSRTPYYDYRGNTGSEHGTIYSKALQVKRNHLKKEFIFIRTIDSIYRRQEHSIFSRKIDLLKIDTEGNELNVLKGARKLLSNNIIKIIQFEFNSMNVASKVFFQDFISLLPNYSFYLMFPDGIVKVDTQKYNPIFHEIFAFHNILAINKKYTSKLLR